MKIIVFSDSHRRSERMVNKLHGLWREYDLAVHLGDVAEDCNAIRDCCPSLPLISIPGNGDFSLGRQPQEMICDLGGVKTLLLHGHTRAVKSGMITLQAYAYRAGVQLVLYGHTHLPDTSYRDGIYFLNPGAASGYSPTYGTVEIVNNQIVTNISDLL